MAALGEEIFRQLPGTWSLDRTIPGFGAMVGTAVFTPEAAGSLLYREEVAVTTEQGARFDGVRAYRYSLSGDVMVVCFADAPRDGEVYVRLDFADDEAGPKAEALHHCGQDLYRHRMTWLDGARFVTEIAVTGPRKDHCLTTRYRRLLVD